MECWALKEGRLIDRLKVIVIAIFLGVLYAYLSIYIIGIGAAIAIPASILTPVVKAYPIVAFAIEDLITIGLPLSAASFIFFFVIMGQTQDWVFTLGTVLFGTGIGITIGPALFGDVNIAAIILLVPSTKI